MQYGRSGHSVVAASRIGLPSLPRSDSVLRWFASANFLLTANGLLSAAGETANAVSPTFFWYGFILSTVCCGSWLAMLGALGPLAFRFRYSAIVAAYSGTMSI